MSDRPKIDIAEIKRIMAARAAKSYQRPPREPTPPPPPKPKRCPLEAFIWIYPRQSSPPPPPAPRAAWRAPVVRRGNTVVLSDSKPRAVLKVSGGGVRGQSRIVVEGCGPVPTRLRDKRKAFVEITTVGKNRRLAVRDATCDGEAVLELASTEVRVQLLRPGSEITITVEPRPDGSVKKRGPKRWVMRRLERPVEGRYRVPKPRV